jgi:hypothetical protein
MHLRHLLSEELAVCGILVLHEEYVDTLSEEFADQGIPKRTHHYLFCFEHSTRRCVAGAMLVICL